MSKQSTEANIAMAQVLELPDKDLKQPPYKCFNSKLFILFKQMKKWKILAKKKKLKKKESNRN